MKIVNYFRKISIYKILITILVAFLILAITLSPDKYVSVSYDGIILWAVCVLPSLLPYFFLTAILTKLNVLTPFLNKLSFISKKLFNLNGCAIYAFIMSVISGYPLGSKLTADLYALNLIDKRQAKKMSLLCSTSGPLFIIGAVGTGMFASKTVGLLIFISHLLSAVFIGLIFRGTDKKEPINDLPLPTVNSDNLLYESVYSSVISVIVVGGFVSVFYVISQILVDFNLLLPIDYIFNLLFKPFGITLEESKAFSQGVIEFTKGAKLLSNITTSPLTVSLTCFLITFGGVSVIAQSLAFLKKAKVNALFFIGGKALQAVIAFILCFILCRYFL